MVTDAGKYAFPAMNSALNNLDQTRRTLSYSVGWTVGMGGGKSSRMFVYAQAKANEAKSYLIVQYFPFSTSSRAALKCAGRPFAEGPTKKLQLNGRQYDTRKNPKPSASIL